MLAIEPEMVLGKDVLDDHGGKVGEVVDVGLYTHSRVKFLVIEDKSKRIPITRMDVDRIDGVTETTVRLKVRA